MNKMNHNKRSQRSQRCARSLKSLKSPQFATDSHNSSQIVANSPNNQLPQSIKRSNQSSNQREIKRCKKTNFPPFLRYYFWSEFDRNLLQKGDYLNLKEQSRKRSLFDFIQNVKNWKIDRRYIQYENNLATKIKFGLIRWYIEHDFEINTETNQPKHKHLNPNPQQMLIGFILKPLIESIDFTDGIDNGEQKFYFLRENDWINLSTDLIFFKRVDYSFLLNVVVVDERSKRRKRFLTPYSFQSPFQKILVNEPPKRSVDSNDQTGNDLRLEEWPSKDELYEIKLVILQSELLSPHQFIHPSEKILGISNNEFSTGMDFEKTNNLFSFDWFNKLPISFEDDWALLRDTCDSHLQDIKDDEEKVITEEATGDVVDQESNLLPDTLDSYAIYSFKSRPHGLLRREWKPLSTKQAIELIKSTIPEKTSLISAGEQNNYRPPNNYFYEGGRLYKILTASAI